MEEKLPRPLCYRPRSAGGKCPRRSVRSDSCVKRILTSPACRLMDQTDLEAVMLRLLLLFCNTTEGVNPQAVNRIIYAVTNFIRQCLIRGVNES